MGAPDPVDAARGALGAATRRGDQTAAALARANLARAMAERRRAEAASWDARADSLAASVKGSDH